MSLLARPSRLLFPPHPQVEAHLAAIIYISSPTEQKLEEATRRSERTVALVRSITPESCTSHVTAVRAKPCERTNTTLGLLALAPPRRYFLRSVATYRATAATRQRVPISSHTCASLCACDRAARLSFFWRSTTRTKGHALPNHKVRDTRAGVSFRPLCSQVAATATRARGCDGDRPALPALLFTTARG